MIVFRNPVKELFTSAIATYLRRRLYSVLVYRRWCKETVVLIADVVFEGGALVRQRVRVHHL